MNKKNVVQVVIEELSKMFPGKIVCNAVPKDLPNEFILVRRDGGERRDMVLDMADVLVSVFNKNSAPECAVLADSIADNVPNLPGVAEDVTRAYVNTVYESNDTIRQYFCNEISCSVYYRR